MPTIVRDILQALESWAPRDFAWERDNIGLQCGNADAPVTSVLVGLDPTLPLVREAARRAANVIVTHHPLFFHRPQRIDLGTTQGQIVQSLLHDGCTLLAAHTNVDAAPGGTNHALAAALGIRDVEFLSTPDHPQKKVVTYVPRAHADRVAAAMASAGAGEIGEYSQCSFRTDGTGTFLGSAATHPAVGQPGVLERVPEIRIEMVVPAWRLDAVVAALRAAHPYEEPAFDVLPTETPDVSHGMGVVGMLPRPMPLRRFLLHVKRTLGVPSVRASAADRRPVQRIALCGGAGRELIPDARRHHADVFVTADLTYHSFQEADSGMVLLDAGHFETERPVIDILVQRLRARFGPRLSVRAGRSAANPVAYV